MLEGGLLFLNPKPEELGEKKEILEQNYYLLLL